MPMRVLPPLVAGKNRWGLPMADRSAAALAELLLGSRNADSLVEVFADDPMLLLWAVCRADQRDHLVPASVAEVAVWLERHALDVLRWETAEPDFPEWDDELWADRVEAAIRLADLARSLASVQEEAVADEAWLRALLSEAGRWLGESPAGDPQKCLPEWLTSEAPCPALEAVELAARIIAGNTADGIPPGLKISLDACNRLAAEGRRRWVESVDGLPRLLPMLAEKSARLAALENRFEQTLEAEKLESMAEFAAGAGHEINNPLTVIAGRAELLLSEESDPERRRALALMNVQAKRVYEMIADMMLFARAPKPAPERVELVALLDELIEQLGPQSARQETTIRRTGDEGPVEIDVDRTQLTVALRAMWQNALEALGGEGHIEMAVRELSNEVEIRVSDDGPGISPEERRHLFDPYYSARQAGRGLGLGLSKAWRIITNHNGRIEVDSQPGQGAVFTITLPKRQA